MARTITLPDGTQESIRFGGTGALKGITGNYKSGKPEELKAPERMFAGCRKLEGEVIHPD